MAFYTFYTPIYRLDGLLKLATAIVSWATVAALFPVVPKALAMRSPEELEREIAARREAEEDLWQARESLELRVSERTGELECANIALKEEIAERKRTEFALSRERNEVLLLNQRLQHAMAETHHRVKNNLQIVGALMEMEILEPGDSVSNAKLQRLAQHVRALASIHDLLTHQAKTDADVEYLSVREALGRLLSVIEGLTERRIELTVAQDIRMPVQQSTALAMVVNEAVANALKHAPTGDIVVSFTAADGAARLEVMDRGPGFPDGFSAAENTSTGLELIERLVEWDLRGTTRHENRPRGGARIVVEFPVPPVQVQLLEAV